MTIARVGLDLAKLVFQVHGVNRAEKVQQRKQLRRSQMLSYFGKLEPCLIGMETCSSVHYWARELSKLGHDVRLMAPQFVKPYVKSGKNDANDAEASSPDGVYEIREIILQRDIVQTCYYHYTFNLLDKILRNRVVET